MISQMKSIQTYLQEESDRGERRSKWQGKLGKQLGPGWGWAGRGGESLEEILNLGHFWIWIRDLCSLCHVKSVPWNVREQVEKNAKEQR